MKRTLAPVLLLLALIGAGLHRDANAEPYLAVGQGYKCNACHVNPTGGGLRNAFGVVFAENFLPAHGLPQGAPAWTGGIGDYLRLGGDLRESWSRTEVPKLPAQQGWGLDQLRLYGNVDVIPNRLGLYVDEALAPGNAQTQEANVRYTHAPGDWYVKAGKFYLPFGWRLQDNSAFVREVSGISMTTPDNGIELGLERPELSAQVALTNGSANAGTGSGHQVTGQVVWVKPQGRIGLAASFTNSRAGDRRVVGTFAGLRTGPLVWLGEADLVQDDGFPEGRRSLYAGLAEVDWGIRRGHNLKLTYEYFDPDRKVAGDQKVRYSLVYEYTPLPFVQLRFGVRRYRGIPQNDVDNRRLVFAEIHGFL
ncbi:MAG: hypothetical protein ACM3PU_06510 [Gemmatimonadota bacterium]